MKKILFVCKGNMTRSQMAEAFYDYLAKDNSASISAGVVTGKIPEEPEGWELDRVPYLKNTLSVMKDDGFDISKKHTEMVTPQMVEEADIVVSMADKNMTPDFILSSPKTIYWNIPNPGFTVEEITAAKEMIWKKVKELFEETEKHVNI